MFLLAYFNYKQFSYDIFIHLHNVYLDHAQLPSVTLCWAFLFPLCFHYSTIVCTPRRTSFLVDQYGHTQGPQLSKKTVNRSSPPAACITPTGAGTIKANQQGGSFQVTFVLIFLCPAPGHMMSSAIGSYPAILVGNKQKLQKPVLLGGLRGLSDHQLLG